MNRALGGRTTVVEAPGGPEIHIRALRLWWPLVFLPFWFAVWTLGGIMAMRQMLVEPRPFLAVWLIGWLAGELFVAVAWSWMAFGEEIVSVAQGTLTLARRLGPWQIARRYPLPACRALRAAGWFGNPMSFEDSLRPWGLTGGTVAVDCGGQPIRFGIGLDEAEAGAVAKVLEPYVGGFQQ